MENYEVIKPIGAGGFGQVFKAVHIQTGKLVAIKKTEMKGDELPSSTLREISLLKSLDSPFVIKYVNDST